MTMFIKTPYGFWQTTDGKARISKHTGWPGENFQLWIYPTASRGVCLGCYATRKSASNAYNLYQEIKP